MKYPSNFLTTAPPISTENPPSVMPDEVSHILRPDLSQTRIKNLVIIGSYSPVVYCMDVPDYTSAMTDAA